MSNKADGNLRKDLEVPVMEADRECGLPIEPDEETESTPKPVPVSNTFITPAPPGVHATDF